MKNQRNPYARILAIDPSTKGFGFAVLEMNGRLIDWGVACLSSKKDEEFLVRVEAMMDRYRPVIVAVEDFTNTRRGERAKRRINRVVGLAQLRDIPRAVVTRAEVRAALGLSDRATKHEAATVIAQLFPELELPLRRKPWQSEDEQMAVFAAVGRNVTVLRDPKCVVTW